jgi:hypothetical protein
LAHHTFFGILPRRQVLEKRCGCGGSIESISVERDTFREKQLLKPLLLIERGLHPEV